MRAFFKVLLAVLIATISFAPQLAYAENEFENPINEEVFYHILIDRYNNGDAKLSEEVDINDELTYHGGDLLGITKKLDTIEEMGFTTLILSPPMKNAKRGYHGYWIEDFYDIEPQFGIMDDFNHLVKEAKGRGIKVVVELVTNYVAESHPLVTDTSKADWFLDTTIEPIASTEWLKETKTLNHDNEEVVDYLTDVIDFWMDETDIAGFKLHAADQASPEFLQSISRHIKEKNPSFYLLAGTLQGDAFPSDIRSIDEIDIFEDVNMFEAMNDVLTKPDEPISILFEEWSKESDSKSGLYVDNINTARFSNNFADNGRNSHTVWQMALTYLYLTPGVPIIYQGSEIPMYGPGFPENQYIVDFTAGDQDLQKIFEKLGLIKENYSTLAHGELEHIAENKGMSLFKRTHNDEAIYFAINNDSESRSVAMDELNEDLQLRGLLDDNIVRQDKDGQFVVGLERESAEILIIQSNAGFNWWFIGFVASVFIVFIGAIVLLSRAQKKRQTNN